MKAERCVKSKQDKDMQPSSVNNVTSVTIKYYCRIDLQ